MAHSITVNLVSNDDGTLNKEESSRVFEKLFAALQARIQTDHDSVAVHVTQFLLANAGLKTCPVSEMVRSIWETRLLDGEFEGKTREEKNELNARLAEVLPEYLRANDDMFHIGRKTGVAIRFVPGDYQKDSDGDLIKDKNGNPIQLYRHSDKEWAVIMQKAAESEARTAAKAAAKSADGGAVSV